MHSSHFGVGFEALGDSLASGLPPPSPAGGGHGRGEGPAHWRVHFLTCFVSLRKEADMRTDVDGENLGLGFGKRWAVFSGHTIVFAGKENEWATLTWLGLSVCACVCMYASVYISVYMCECVGCCVHTCARAHTCEVCLRLRACMHECTCVHECTCRFTHEHVCEQV